MKIRLKFIICALCILSTTACFRTNGTADLGHLGKHNQIFNFAGVEDLHKFLTYSDKRVPLVSAHRGGPDLDYPENALETFQRVAYKTPSIIECDIALSKDSVLVLMHDETLDRTTTGKGNTIHKTLEELKKLRLKDTQGNLTSYQIPTLEEALAWGKGKVIFTLDIKRNVPYRLVVDAIRKTHAEAYVALITYNVNQAALVNNLAPDLMISASIRNADDLIRLNDADVPDTRILAFIGTKEADRQLTDLLHQHGILCILGTMGNLDRQAETRGDQLYAEFIERGADILSTDRPVQAAKSLQYYIRKRGLSSPYID
ncbi:glycerophosphodiester phosphodiesterase family protein [Sphingobacterium griseoflavum]|uniref:Glycerophosphoryl diester phosphodiesterase n=1 Tax=Sphingobacterium griseoflavum TaxID=1474952 RepID=A0ABQ3HRU6_9SPHI|nr:glycerophosphodiester phosphodiesterase family protein [Sphingobacterium griseoflavum]GHE23048.1 glycerophosphoryl diester phosphodiesterase [Sphingobacterium griseoflavum]